MNWSPDLFGRLVPSPDLLRRKKTGGDATPARQLDFLEGLCLTISGASGGASATPSIHVPDWIEGVCKAMNPDTNDLLSAHEVGGRWAEALRRRFPGPCAAKAAAKQLRRDLRTVEAWMGGQAPQLHAALDAALRLRDPLILFELAGIAPPQAVVVDGELEALRSDLDRLGERIARLKGAP